LDSEQLSEYNDKIKSIEADYNRKICGYPDSDKNPCTQWPVDKQGRCYRHSGLSLEEGLKKAEATTDEFPEEPGPDASDLPSKTHARSLSKKNESKFTAVQYLRRSVLYWLLIASFGLGAGAYFKVYFQLHSLSEVLLSF
jgi:hypothetical protein